MHSLMTSVLLRTPRLNALVNDPHLHPSEREFRQAEQARPSERRAIVRSNSGRHSILPHRRIANGSNLTQVHSGDDLTADQITTMGIGDRERIATRAIARSEVSLKIHAPELIGGCHLREGLRVWRRASLFALWARKASSLKDVAEGTGHWPLHARIQLL